MNLEENLKIRHKLQFKNGKFRVLVFSDMHGIKNYDKRLIRDMNAIIEKYKPDVVLINGDMGWRDAVTDKENLREYLKGMLSPMENRHIPWAFVFGNHDDEKGLENEEQFEIYNSFDYCLSKKGPEAVSGVGNFVLPVLSSDGSKIAFNIWGLDSHDSMYDYINEFDLEKDPWFFNLPEHYFPYSKYDALRFNQVMWYWQSSEELNKHNGSKIPGIMFFHIPLPEFCEVYKNVAQCTYRGNRRESCGNGPFNSGMFNALVERGEVKTVICGHDHINDFQGVFCKITLAMDGGIGYDGYCDDDMRGGRIVDIDENDPFNPVTYMVRSADCVKDYPGACERIYGNE